MRVSTFVEALDFVLLPLIDALESGAGEPVDQLVQITEDRGGFVERVRQEYLADEASVTANDRAVLLQVTSVFERAVWMTHRLARLIDGDRRTRIMGLAASGLNPAGRGAAGRHEHETGASGLLDPPGEAIGVQGHGSPQG